MTYNKDYFDGLNGLPANKYKRTTEYISGQKRREEQERNKKANDEAWKGLGDSIYSSPSQADNYLEPTDLTPIINPIKDAWYFLVGKPHNFETGPPVNPGVWNWGTITAFSIGFIAVISLLIWTLYN